MSSSSLANWDGSQSPTNEQAEDSTRTNSQSIAPSGLLTTDKLIPGRTDTGPSSHNQARDATVPPLHHKPPGAPVYTDLSRLQHVVLDGSKYDATLEGNVNVGPSTGSFAAHPHTSGSTHTLGRQTSFGDANHLQPSISFVQPTVSPSLQPTTSSSEEDAFMHDYLNLNGSPTLSPTNRVLPTNEPTPSEMPSAPIAPSPFVFPAPPQPFTGFPAVSPAHTRSMSRLPPGYHETDEDAEGSPTIPQPPVPLAILSPIRPDSTGGSEDDVEAVVEEARSSDNMDVRRPANRTSPVAAASTPTPSTPRRPHTPLFFPDDSSPIPSEPAATPRGSVISMASTSPSASPPSARVPSAARGEVIEILSDSSGEDKLDDDKNDSDPPLTRKRRRRASPPRPRRRRRRAASPPRHPPASNPSPAQRRQNGMHVFLPPLSHPREKYKSHAIEWYDAHVERIEAEEAKTMRKGKGKARAEPQPSLLLDSGDSSQTVAKIATRTEPKKGAMHPAAQTSSSRVPRAEANPRTTTKKHKPDRRGRSHAVADNAGSVGLTEMLNRAARANARGLEDAEDADVVMEVANVDPDVSMDDENEEARIGAANARGEEDDKMHLSDDLEDDVPLSSVVPQARLVIVQQPSAKKPQLGIKKPVLSSRSSSAVATGPTSRPRPRPVKATGSVPLIPLVPSPAPVASSSRHRLDTVPLERFDLLPPKPKPAPRRPVGTQAYVSLPSWSPALRLKQTSASLAHRRLVKRTIDSEDDSSDHIADGESPRDASPPVTHESSSSPDLPLASQPNPKRDFSFDAPPYERIVPEDIASSEAGILCGDERRLFVFGDEAETEGGCTGRLACFFTQRTQPSRAGPIRAHILESATQDSKRRWEGLGNGSQQLDEGAQQEGEDSDIYDGEDENVTHLSPQGWDARTKLPNHRPSLGLHPRNLPHERQSSPHPELHRHGATPLPAVSSPSAGPSAPTSSNELTDLCELTSTSPTYTAAPATPPPTSEILDSVSWSPPALPAFSGSPPMASNIDFVAAHDELPARSIDGQRPAQPTERELTPLGFRELTPPPPI
ncbi:hypothetical protein K488DRAFT_85858 [Vararia minispora EC-137]|uniref:Uncharacterized protein n=1 Tax=Vararia minispora EC-137 TaxID=1314806 RepID=A0ACB8QM69_9AGAM|nr:hypothetical protein K488DRAFT_85858 [Vararia minispora EC-137]